MIRILSHRLFVCVGGVLVAAAALYGANAASDSGSVAPAGTVIRSQGGTGAADSERSFLMENQRAMDRMMTGMSAKPTGDVDVDFAAVMIPHHQGAIDMALSELRYGRNEQLRRIAQEIIVDQQQEIAAMRLALGQPLSASVSASTGSSDRDATSAPAAPVHTTKDMPK